MTERPTPPRLALTQEEAAAALGVSGDLKLVQKLLGHESIRTTGDVYVDYDIDQWALLLAKAHESEGEDA